MEISIRKKLYNKLQMILGEHYMPELIEICLGFSYFNNENKFKEISEEKPSTESFISTSLDLSDVSIALATSLYKKYVSKAPKNGNLEDGMKIAINLSCEDYFRNYIASKGSDDKR